MTLLGVRKRTFIITCYRCKRKIYPREDHYTKVWTEKTTRGTTTIWDEYREEICVDCVPGAVTLDEFAKKFPAINFEKKEQEEKE